MAGRVLCSGCGKELGEALDAGGRRSCGCGSVVRRYDEALTEIVRVMVSVEFKHKRKGYRGYLAKGKSGWERSANGRLVHKVSLFEREADRRYERVVDDETGEVIHHVDHKLTEHVGHGSAKKSKPKAK